MIKLIRFALAYYKLYKYRVREQKLKDELLTLTGKIATLKVGLARGYTSEIEFANRLSQLSGARDKNIMMTKKEKESSFEESKRIATRVAEAVQNYEDEVTNG